MNILNLEETIKIDSKNTINVANTTLIENPIKRNNNLFHYSSDKFLPNHLNGIGKAYANISNDPEGYCSLGHRIPLKENTKYKVNSNLHDDLPGRDKEFSENSSLCVSLHTDYVDIALGGFKAKNKEEMIKYFNNVVKYVNEKMENKEINLSNSRKSFNLFIKPEL